MSFSMIYLYIYLYIYILSYVMINKDKWRLAFLSGHLYIELKIETSCKIRNYWSPYLPTTCFNSIGYFLYTIYNWIEL